MNSHESNLRKAMNSQMKCMQERSMLSVTSKTIKSKKQPNISNAMKENYQISNNQDLRTIPERPSARISSIPIHTKFGEIPRKTREIQQKPKTIPHNPKPNPMATSRRPENHPRKYIKTEKDIRYTQISDKETIEHTVHKSNIRKNQVIPVVTLHKSTKPKMKRTQIGFIHASRTKKRVQAQFSYEDDEVRNLCCDQDIERTKKVRNIRDGSLIVEKPPVKILTPEEEIADFERRIPQIMTQFENQTFQYAKNKDKETHRMPIYNEYMEKHQFNLSWLKRAVLIDWMMQVLQQAGNKRQTFAQAVSILDRYLTLAPAIEVRDLQLVGATCMLIGNKLQDNMFSVNDIYEAAGCNYSVDEILLYQLRVVRVLGWNLSSTTSNMWGNRLGKQWDDYLQANPELVASCQPIARNKGIRFKAIDNQAYENYRWLMQYIDFSVLDVQTLRYSARTLSASFIYIVLIKRLGLFSDEQLIREFPHCTNYLTDDCQFNRFFNDFLTFSFGCQLIELLPTIQYCATFVIVPLNNEIPLAIRNNDKDVQYEEFCSFQTRNKAAMVYLQKRDRR